MQGSRVVLTRFMILAADTRGELISRRKRVPIKKSPIPFRKPSYYRMRTKAVSNTSQFRFLPLAEGSPAPVPGDESPTVVCFLQTVRNYVHWRRRGSCSGRRCGTWLACHRSCMRHRHRCRELQLQTLKHAVRHRKGTSSLIFYISTSPPSPAVQAVVCRVPHDVESCRSCRQCMECAERPVRHTACEEYS